MTDEEYMEEALKCANKAFKKAEVPIGAIVVQNGKIIGKGFNLREKKRNAILHAEVCAISSACKKIGDWRLAGSTLYVTLEPCMMCLGAALNARIDKVVFGAYDANGKKEKQYCISSLNHTLNVEGGTLEQKCKDLLQKFFKEKRK